MAAQVLVTPVIRGVFRTLLNICDADYFHKKLSYLCLTGTEINSCSLIIWYLPMQCFLVFPVFQKYLGKLLCEWQFVIKKYIFSIQGYLTNVMIEINKQSKELCCHYFQLSCHNISLFTLSWPKKSQPDYFIQLTFHHLKEAATTCWLLLT